MALPKALRYAVLHVGSSSMSITIVEYRDIDDVRIIDHAFGNAIMPPYELPSTLFLTLF